MEPMPFTIQSAEKILPFEECSSIIAQQAREILITIEAGALGIEQADIQESLGRVLAEDLVADRDFPPFRRSTRDGFACRTSDLRTLPAVLRVVAEIAAGEKPFVPGGSLRPGEAAEIMTGAPVPPGADCVVMIEHTEAEHRDAAHTGVEELPCIGQQIRILRQVAPGDNIVETGSESHAGERLLLRGTRISYAATAVAAAVGQRQLQVYRRPRVAVLATGNELVEIGDMPEPHQIRNSNSYSLAAQIRAAGAAPCILPIARDDHEDLRGAIRAGLDHDLLVIAGGVSAGKYDLVEDILRELEAEFLFTGALIQPGKPTVFARVPAAMHTPSQAGRPPEKYRYCFGLPGNPISTMVAFEIFVRPLLAALSGAHTETSSFAKARLLREIRVKTGLTRFLPARLTGNIHTAEVEAIAWHGSGDIVARSGANCYIVVPPDCKELQTGDLVTVLQTE